MRVGSTRGFLKALSTTIFVHPAPPGDLWVNLQRFLSPLRRSEYPESLENCFSESFPWEAAVRIGSTRGFLKAFKKRFVFVDPAPPGDLWGNLVARRNS